MSFLFRSFPTAAELIPRRRNAGRSHVVSTEDAMHNSVVWACLRLRADLISTSPVDCFRNIDGRAVNFKTPPVLVNPGGSTVGIAEWLYSSQVDLDRFGNCFGIISARDGLGLPARIDLVSAESVTVKSSAGMITKFKIGQTEYEPRDIWHEKQFTVAGVPVGLSPLAAAALTLSTSKSAQEFAADWFAGSGVPASHLKNSAQVLTSTEAETIKARFTETVQTGDVFVTGSDWDYTMLGAKASESSFIEAHEMTAQDMCRFLGVPGDMVDVNTTSGSITYANITQRNLQLLIINLGPAVTRRQTALSLLLPPPRYVKLNTDAVVLRMDPQARAELNGLLLTTKQRTPSEVREKDDLPPFTPEQVAEIQAFGGTGTEPSEIERQAQVLQKMYLAVGVVLTADEARDMARKAGIDLPKNYDPAELGAAPAPPPTEQKSAPPQVFHIDARQDAPVVNVTLPTQDPPVVHVAAAEVVVNVPEQRAGDITVNVPEQPAPVINIAARELATTVRRVERDKDGRIERVIDEES